MQSPFFETFLTFFIFLQKHENTAYFPELFLCTPGKNYAIINKNLLLLLIYSFLNITILVTGVPTG